MPELTLETIVSDHHINNNDELEPPLSSEEIRLVLRGLVVGMEDNRSRAQIAQDIVMAELQLSCEEQIAQ